MQKIVRIAGCALACCCLFATASLIDAQAAQPAKPAVGSAQTPSEAYGKLLSIFEKEFVDAADAMPEEKFDFVPTSGDFKGVRSFGSQIKHVAESNAFFFHDPSKPSTDLQASQDAIEKLKTKADIIKALKDSFSQAHAYIDAITPENAFLTLEGRLAGTRATMASFGMAHLMDHYGQLAVYLRLNGIVPPASRGQN